jgi:hypothetical protein
MGRKPLRSRVLLNVPLLVAAAMIAAFSTDIPMLRPLKTEFTFGYWLLLVPAAWILLAVQVVLWVIRFRSSGGDA